MTGILPSFAPAGDEFAMTADDQWEEGTPAWRPGAGSLRITARR